MKSLYLCVVLLFIGISLNSCNKDVVSDLTNNDISIEKISGTYKGGTLYWEKSSFVTNSTNGSDPNASFTVNYSANYVNVTINTTEPISKKTFRLPLTDRQETPVNGVLAIATYGFSEGSTAQNFTGSSISFGLTRLNTSLPITVTGGINYNVFTNAGANSSEEKVYMYQVPKL